MKLKQAIDRADNLRPNAFTYEQKTDFINELEHMIQANEYLVRPEDMQKHYWEAEWECNISFPDDHTMIPDTWLGLHPHSTITISDTALNNGDFVIKDVHRNTYFFPIGSFTPNDAPETGKISYNGQDDVLLVGAPFDELYVSWLIAKIDYHNGDFDRYANTEQAFENQYGRFKVWFTTHYCNDRGVRYAKRRR